MQNYKPSERQSMSLDLAHQTLDGPKNQTVFAEHKCAANVNKVKVLAACSCHSRYFFPLQTFLAQRYGHKPLRTHIPVEELKLLTDVMEVQTVKQLVQKWYTLDTNAVPFEYVLQSPIT